MGDYRDLIVFQKSYKLAMDIFEESRKFPPEEKYSLTDQIRRSSRSVLHQSRRGTSAKKIPAILYFKIDRL